ncbi:MAG: cysteine synthase family protein [Acidobacteria bacterium]|jgi:cysteine synthase B|nr:cysteine synthase family protein [Acidobacteriota bacterium]
MAELTAVEKNRLLARIGNTPLVQIRTIFRSDKIRILAKLEWFNPGGSVKDRPALSMIRRGEETGELHPGKTIVDSTSGNTGIAYAFIAAVKGYKTLLAMPENASLERKQILTAYGAELLLTDPLEGSDGSIRVIRELVEKSPDQYFYPDQYSNDANWQAHYNSTAPEIYSECHQEVTHFVAGLGTSGTFVGTSRRLKESDPQIQTISFMPDSPFHGLEGLKHMPSAIVPRIYDSSLADENLEISTEEAQRMVIRLAREEGLFAGLSSGAALVAALQVARNIDRGTIVTIFPDSGDKYLSEEFWKEQ